MYETVRNFAIDWQDWVSTADELSYGELAGWTGAIAELAKLADPSGKLTEELEENGII